MGDFLVQLWPLGATVLVILGAAALIALIVVLVRAAKTMKNVNVITQEAEEKVTPALKRVDPLVDRVELTVDTLNLELLRVDAILEDVESVTDVAGKTAETVNTITTAPTEAVTSVVDRVRGALSSRHKNKAKEGRFVYPIGTGADQGGDGRAQTVTTASKEAAAEEPAAQRSASIGTLKDAERDASAYDDLKAAAESAAREIEAEDSAASEKGGA